MNTRTFGLEGGLALGDRLKSVAPWTGTLVLPDFDERRADGAVPCLLSSAPFEYLHLIGTTVFLAWCPDWAQPENLLSVVYSKMALKAERVGYSLCSRLRDWCDISPLESIAGCRPEGKLFVRFEPSAVHSDEASATVHLAQAPIEISGTHMACVQFVSASNDSEICTVRHFDAQRGDFEDVIQPMRHAPLKKLAGMPFLKTSLDEIEKSALNVHGWYVYGTFSEDGEFTFRALEPRALMQWSPRLVDIGSLKNVDEEIGELLADTQRHHATHIESIRPIADVRGQKLLVGHFSWGPQVGRTHFWSDFFWHLKKSLPMTVKLVNLLFPTVGHVALGYARIVDDPFTGNTRLEITYKNAFFQNANGMASLDQAWHAYSGSLVNGRAFASSYADVLIQLDSLDNAPNDLEQIFNVIDREVDKIGYHMRLGGGHGFHPGTLLYNCSTAALYVFLRAFQEKIAALPRWARPASIINRTRSRSVSIHNFSFGALGFRNPLRQLHAFWFVPVKTPLAFFKFFLRTALNEDLSVLVIRTNFVGGTIKDVSPGKPLG